MKTHLIATELDYLRCFSKEENQGECIIFTDDQIEDMYSHNMIYIKTPLAKAQYIELIKNHIDKAKERGIDFLNFQLDFEDEVLFQLAQSQGAELTTYSYYEVKRETMMALEVRKDWVLEKVNKENQAVARAFDLTANGEMGRDFIRRRFERRSQVYFDKEGVDQYLCCYRCEVIGHCDYFISEKVVKLEDFDIASHLQRKGFGTAMLKALSQYAYDQGAEIVYVITDAEDTAKEMYEKCGMQKVGSKYELLFKW